MAIDDNTSYELTGTQIKDFATKIKSKADSSSLAPVATSGNYNDLSNLPTLPTVNNGALTIQQNGKTLGTFTANSSDNKTVNIQAITTGEVGAITASMIDWLSVMDKIYPVGSIYMSATMSTVEQVQTALGGTWVVWGEGRVPVGVDTSQTEFDTVEETGGEKTHTLVENELPKISGSWTIHGQESGTEFYTLKGHATGSLKSNQYKTIGLTATTGANSYSNPGFAFGNDGAHNNLQPYITCYMYKRTA